MNKFQEYNLTLTDKEKSLVEQYVARITEYTKKHSVDQDVLRDIEDMLFEKLAAEPNLNELKIRKILKTVGEPEVIFADYTDESAPKTAKNDDRNLPFYEDLRAEGWERSNDRAIVLGISEVIARKTRIDIRVIRALFIVGVIFFGT